MFEELLRDDEKLYCPYCGEEQDGHEPDEISSDMCYTECEHCGKNFWYSVNVTRTYSSSKDDDDEDSEDNLY